MRNVCANVLMVAAVNVLDFTPDNNLKYPSFRSYSTLLSARSGILIWGCFICLILVYISVAISTICSTTSLLPVVFDFAAAILSQSRLSIFSVLLFFIIIVVVFIIIVVVVITVTIISRFFHCFL